MRPSRSLNDRFWEKVAISDDEACWEWLGARDGKGYGQLRGDDGYKHVSAHRASLILNGRDPGSNHIHHICGNILCVNPQHLELITNRAHGHKHNQPKWTRDLLIETIQEFNDTYGRPPSVIDWNVNMANKRGHAERVLRYRENHWPTSATVQTRFGSWSNALEAAGFPRPKRGRPKSA